MVAEALRILILSISQCATHINNSENIKQQRGVAKYDTLLDIIIQHFFTILIKNKNYFQSSLLEKLI